MVRTQVEKKNKHRFEQQLLNIDKAIVLHSEDLKLNSKKDLIFQAKRCKIQIAMGLKRLLHKQFIGKREKNEKTTIKGHMYLATMSEDSDLTFFTFCEKNQINVLGVIFNGKLEYDYLPYLYAKFNAQQLFALTIGSITKCLLFAMNDLGSQSEKK